MTTWKRMKKCATERKRANKKIFIWSHESKTPGSRDREISFPPDFGEGCKTRGGNGRCCCLFCSKVQRKWLGFVFKFKAVQPATFEHEIYSVQLFPRENLKNPQMKTQGCFDTRFFACLTFSSKWVTFFSKDSSNFRQYFGGVFLKSVLFILCFLQTLETKRCWLWRAFAHVSPTLRSESFGIYIFRITFAK